MVVLGIVAGLATTAEKNDDYIESNEKLDKCVKFDVREDSTVGVKIAELLKLNVSTSIDEQFSLKVQKTAEVPRTQFIDKVVDVPVDMQRQVQQFKLCRRPWRFHRFSTVQTVQKTAEITQVQFLDKVVEMPTVVQRQVTMVQVVQKTVSHEERQSACVIATRRVAAYQLTSTAWN